MGVRRVALRVELGQAPLPRSGRGERRPDRVVHREIELPREGDHPLVPGVRVRPAVVDVEERCPGLEREELRLPAGHDEVRELLAHRRGARRSRCPR